jgi:hypothetical protein
MRDAGPQARERTVKFWGREAGESYRVEAYSTVKSWGARAPHHRYVEGDGCKLSIRDWAACFGVLASTSETGKIA